MIVAEWPNRARLHSSSRCSSFPLLAPTLLAAVAATRELFNGVPLAELGDYLKLMGVFDVVFIAGMLNTMVWDLYARPEIKSGEQLRGKIVGTDRPGSPAAPRLTRSDLRPRKPARKPWGQASARVCSGRTWVWSICRPVSPLWC